jgi:NDP-sugar pyrophosphorylase family protein
VEAVVFAAGLGTRLRPLTDGTPKALLEVGGVPLLERILRSLAAVGVDRAVVTTCHLAEQVERFAAARRGTPPEVALSREPGGPYETGGGLVHARPLLAERQPFFVHVGDVVTDLPLRALWEAHRAWQPLATLAVMDRPASRRLLFDERGLLGHRDERTGVERRARPARGDVVALGFCGIQVVAPDLLALLHERGTFSLTDAYLRLAGEGATVLPHRVDGSTWIDVGRPADLERARSLALPA